MPITWLSCLHPSDLLSTSGEGTSYCTGCEAVQRKRTTIINNVLLDWFRRRTCELCGDRGFSDPHHLRGRGLGGGSRYDVSYNLISLCRKCHRLEQDYPSEFVRRIVAKRMGWTFEQHCEALLLLNQGIVIGVDRTVEELCTIQST